MTGSALLFGTGLALMAGYWIAQPFLARRHDLVRRLDSSRAQRLSNDTPNGDSVRRETGGASSSGALSPEDLLVGRHKSAAEGWAVVRALAGLAKDDPVDAAMERDIASWKRRSLTMDCGRE